MREEITIARLAADPINLLLLRLLITLGSDMPQPSMIIEILNIFLYFLNNE